jgi:hypothetical protein
MFIPTRVISVFWRVALAASTANTGKIGLQIRIRKLNPKKTFL